MPVCSCTAITSRYVFPRPSFHAWRVRHFGLQTRLLTIRSIFLTPISWPIREASIFFIMTQPKRRETTVSWRVKLESKLAFIPFWSWLSKLVRWLAFELLFVYWRQIKFKKLLRMSGSDSSEVQELHVQEKDVIIDHVRKLFGDDVAQKFQGNI